MSRYVRKCPRCGSTDIHNECEWDTVTAQECNNCGWSRDIGCVGGTPGDHYLVEWSREEEDTRDELAELDSLEDARSSEGTEELARLDDEDNDLPF